MATTRLGLYGGPRGVLDQSVTVAISGVEAVSAVGFVGSGVIALTGVEAIVSVDSVALDGVVFDPAGSPFDEFGKLQKRILARRREEEELQILLAGVTIIEQRRVA